MARHIAWSPESENDLSMIINYLISEWNVEVASRFLKDTEYHTNIIAKRPKLYPIIYKKQGLRNALFLNKIV
nr:type II toxin-antitoxin system RelE/ParE family toxin [uncultured Pedobacter sp.]